MGNQNPPHNPNLNPNQNIQKISVEPREPHIVVVTRGGVVTGVDQEALYRQPQARSTAQKKAPFDVQKEMEVFLDVRQEFKTFYLTLACIQFD